MGYGYLWWIMPDGSYLATGTGGQKLRIYPDDQIVLVNRVDTGAGITRGLWTLWGGTVDNTQISELMRRVRAAGRF